MGDSLTTVAVIALAAVLMFVFPLLTVSENSDNTSSLSVQNATTEFVENIRSTGKITLAAYDKYIQTINSTGNTFDVQIEVQILDENPGKKTTQTNYTKIGENIYYTKYTTQVLSDIQSGKMTLKEGDIVTVTANNTNTTIAQTLRNFLYRLAGNNTASIVGSHSGVVTSNGSGK